MRQFKIKESITHRDNLLDKYLVDIGKIERITPAEEVDLAKRIKAGDEKALEKLVNANLRFAVSVAKQYQNQWVSLPDLINEGNIWLIKAAKRFDETRGFKFISYAVWWIRQGILQAIIDQWKTIRLPMSQQWHVYTINKTRDLLEQKLQRTPVNEEIAAVLDLDFDKIQATIWAWNIISLDAPIAYQDRETSVISDTISSTTFPQPDDFIEKEWTQKEIFNLLHQLSGKEEFVLTHYFGIGKAGREHTTEEIASLLWIPKDAVRQTKEKAIRRLRIHTKTSEKYKNL